MVRVLLYVSDNVSTRRWSSRDYWESRYQPASRKLQRLVLVSSRTKFWTSRSHFGLGSKGLVHIPGITVLVE